MKEITGTIAYRYNNGGHADVTDWWHFSDPQ
jgi:hypothetical protein